MTTRQLCLKCGSPLPHSCTGISDNYIICCSKLISKTGVNAHKRSKTCIKNKHISKFQSIKFQKICKFSEANDITEDQIIVVMRGKHAGSIFKYKENMYLTEYFNKIDLIGNSINNDYLYHILKWKKIHNEGGYVIIDSVNDMEIPAPPLTKQIEIASVLDELDKKIEQYNDEISRLNYQLESTLENFILWSIIPITEKIISSDAVINNVLSVLTGLNIYDEEI